MNAYEEKEGTIGNTLRGSISTEEEDDDDDVEKKNRREREHWHAGQGKGMNEYRLVFVLINIDLLLCVRLEQYVSSFICVVSFAKQEETTGTYMGISYASFVWNLCKVGQLAMNSFY